MLPHNDDDSTDVEVVALGGEDDGHEGEEAGRDANAEADDEHGAVACHLLVDRNYFRRWNPCLAQEVVVDGRDNHTWGKAVVGADEGCAHWLDFL